MQQELKKLGLSQNEQTVYLNLIKIGETNIGPLISRTRLHRQSVYNALTSLEEKGLILKNTKNKVSHFKVNDPQIFIENIKKKELIAQRLSRQIEAAMKKTKYVHEINVFEGRQQIRDYFCSRNENLPPGSDIYIISNYAAKYEEVLGKYFLKNKYDDLIIKKKLYVKIIAGQSHKKAFKDFFKNYKSIPTRKLKFLPDHLIYPMAAEITDECVSFSSFEKDWFVIEIRDQSFVKAFQKQFQIFWKMK